MKYIKSASLILALNLLAVGCIGGGLNDKAQVAPGGGGGSSNENNMLLAGTSTSDSVCQSVSGMVYCTGNNAQNQVVSHGPSTLSQAVAVSWAPSGFLSFAMGLSTAYVIHSDGSVYGRGSGDLGNGGTAASATEVAVQNLSGPAIQVGSGTSFGCALIQGGTVQCWGLGTNGRLGNGTNTTANSAVSVTGISNATQISVGPSSACARLSDGTVKCWGGAAPGGMLGNGATVDSNVPVNVVVTGGANLTGVSGVAVGGTVACALLTSGTVMCWAGGSGYGELGQGNLNSSDVALLVPGLTQVKAISLGQSHACALLQSGSVSCWGRNTFGQLGVGTTANGLSPAPVSGILTASAIVAGGLHTCAQMLSGAIMCWGDTSYQQFGAYTAKQTTPVSISVVTAPAAPTQLSFVGHSTYSGAQDGISGGCIPFLAMLESSGGQQSEVATSDVTFTTSVALNPTDGGAVAQTYSDSACNVPATSFTIHAGTSTVNLYFLETDTSFIGSGQINATVTSGGVSAPAEIDLSNYSF